MTEAHYRHKKHFGQHFLHDPVYLDRIVSAIRPQSDDLMVEIGPGQGALTRPLLEKLQHLHVVEIDRDLTDWLRQHFPTDQLSVHQADVLKFDFASLLRTNDEENLTSAARLRVTGNLPYNISSPILFHLAGFAEQIVDMHFMLQKEVVDRMAAAPDTPDYGRLSVMLQGRFKVMKLFNVPPGAFNPPPKVDSAIVRLVPLALERLPYQNAARFSDIVARAFGQRRKTLRNTLKGILDAATIESLGIDPQRRGETLSVVEFSRLADKPPQG